MSTIWRMIQPASPPWVIWWEHFLIETYCSDDGCLDDIHYQSWVIVTLFDWDDSMSLWRSLRTPAWDDVVFPRYLSRSQAVFWSSAFLASRTWDPESVFGDSPIVILRSQVAQDPFLLWVCTCLIYAIFSDTRSDGENQIDRSYIRIVSSRDPLVE